jgi:hypothetical protein
LWTAVTASAVRTSLEQAVSTGNPVEGHFEIRKVDWLPAWGHLLEA